MEVGLIFNYERLEKYLNDKKCQEPNIKGS
jgi:hypothetical protein